MDETAGRRDRLLCGQLLVISGLALLLFGPNQSKLVGAAYLVIAVFFYAVVPVVERFGSHPRIERVLVLRPALSTRWVPLALRIFLGAAGIALAASCWIWRAEFPDRIRDFYISLGVLLAAYAALQPAAARAVAALSPRTVHRLATILGVTLCVVPIAALGAVVYVYGTNAPFFDEYISTLPFQSNFASMTWEARLADLTGSHFGHRIAVTRLLGLAQVRVFGGLNFHHLMLFDVLFLAAGLLLVFISLRRPRPGWLGFAPFMLIFLHPQFHQIILWAFGSPHLASFCFAALTLLLVSRGTAPAFWIAMACSVVAAYSFATGLFAGLVGLAVLIDQKRDRQAMFWLIPTTLLHMRYFSDLDVSGRNDALVRAGLRAAPALSRKLEYSLEFLGSGSALGVFSDFLGHSERTLHAFPASKTIALVTGGVLVGVFAYATLRRYWRVNPTVYGLMAITVIAAALAGDQRGYNPEGAFLSRYVINSVLMMALAYLAILELHPRVSRALVPLAVLAAVLFNAFSYAVTLPIARKHQSDLQFGTLLAANAVFQHTLPVPIGLPLFGHRALADAVATRTYRIPTEQLSARFAAAPLDTGSAWAPADALPWDVLYVGENESAYTILLGPRVPGMDADVVGIVLADAAGLGIAFEASPFSEFPGHPDWMASCAPDGATHYAVVPKSHRGNERWRLGIAVRSGGKAEMGATAIVLPTISVRPTVFAEQSADEILHVPGRCSSVLPPGFDACWLDIGAAGPDVILPDEFSISLLAIPSDDYTAGGARIFTLTAGAGAEATPMRLSLHSARFVLSVGHAGAWHDVAKLEVVADAPNYVTVSVGGGEVSLIAIAPDSSGAITQARIGTAKLDRPPGPIATLHTGDGTNEAGTPAVKLWELRITDGATTLEDAVKAWPLPEAGAR